MGRGDRQRQQARPVSAHCFGAAFGRPSRFTCFLALLNSYKVSPVSDTAIDPVCGMIVETASARHRSTYDSQDYFFCCSACERLFERNLQEYLMHER